MARVVALLVLAAWCRPQSAALAQAHGAEITFSSGHADRGIIISDRPVIQPVTWVTGRVAEFSLWGSFPLAENSDQSRPQIAEVELTHHIGWGKVTITPAIRMFFYHDPPSSYSTHSL